VPTQSRPHQTHPQHRHPCLLLLLLLGTQPPLLLGLLVLVLVLALAPQPPPLLRGLLLLLLLGRGIAPGTWLRVLGP
jgi:hypothetical protein